MNCIDVSRLLDDGQFALLTSAERLAFETHCARCDDCASQRLAAERVAAFRAEVPPLPESLLQRASQLEQVRIASAPQKQSRRPVLLGSLLLAGIAATGLSGLGWQESASGRAVSS